MLPNYLTDVFTNTNEIHDYNTTRQSECNFVLPKPNTNYMKKAFAYRGAETSNNLPVDLRSISGFKTQTKIKHVCNSCI